jgi:hypothetical protein
MHVVSIVNHHLRVSLPSGGVQEKVGRNSSSGAIHQGGLVIAALEEDLRLLSKRDLVSVGLTL